MSDNENVEKDRSVFNDLNNEGVNISKQIVGLLGYVIIFVILIPYLLIKKGHTEALEAYFPNLDLIATVIGYGSGLFGMGFQKYLYNPSVTTLYGYWSSQLINYMALLGVTYVIAFYTLKTKSILKGWSRSFFMLVITYLLPGNVIAELMYNVGNKVHGFIPRTGLLHNYVMYLIGGIIVALIIMFEQFMIEQFSGPLISVLEAIKKTIV